MKKLAALVVPVMVSGCFLSAKELQVESRLIPSAIQMAPAYAMPPAANVFNGTGGTKRMLVSHTSQKEGAGLWLHGTPPCTYEVLDVVTDRRGAGRLAMQGLETDMIREVSAKGGTDIIILEQKYEEEERPPIYNVSAGGQGPQTVMAPVKISNTRYAITRCLDGAMGGIAPAQVPQQRIPAQGVMHYESLPRYGQGRAVTW